MKMTELRNCRQRQIAHQIDQIFVNPNSEELFDKVTDILLPI